MPADSKCLLHSLKNTQSYIFCLYKFCFSLLWADPRLQATQVGSLQPGPDGAHLIVSASQLASQKTNSLSHCKLQLFQQRLCGRIQDLLIKIWHFIRFSPNRGFVWEVHLFLSNPDSQYSILSLLLRSPPLSPLCSPSMFLMLRNAVNAFFMATCSTCTVSLAEDCELLRKRDRIYWEAV